MYSCTVRGHGDRSTGRRGPGVSVRSVAAVTSLETENIEKLVTTSGEELSSSVEIVR